MRNLLTIMRGLSGSGKSGQARHLAAVSNGIVISTDDYWCNGDGDYNFELAKLADAHTDAQRRVLDNMSTGEPRIILDNTNTRWWEMFPYLEMAREFSYGVEILMVGGLSPADIAVYAERNTHGTPLDVIKRQADHFEMMMDPEAGYHLEKLRQSIMEALKDRVR